MSGKAILIGLDAAVPTLLEQYVRDGHLPNISRLLAMGSYARAHSAFPGITPVNWATIATGAYPGAHGITDFLIHESGEPLDSFRNAFRSTELKAETLWQAAERGGLKVATINFPGSWPAGHRRGYCLAGEGSPGTGCVFEIRSSSCFASPRTAAKLRDATVVQPLSIGEQADGNSGRTVSDGTPCFVGEITLQPFKDTNGRGPTYQLVLTRDAAGKPEGRIFAAAAGDASAKAPTPGEGWPAHVDPVATCGLGEWTSWLEADFEVFQQKHRGTFRFKLTRCSDDCSEFNLYCSQVMPVDGIARPAEIGSELVSAVGPFIENCGARGYERGWVELETFLEEGEYKAQWLARAAGYLLDHKAVDVLLLKWHFLDHIQHLLWGKIDPISPWYRHEEWQRYEQAMIRAYRAADALVGAFLSHIERGYHLAVVSDHGHIPHLKAMSVNNLLAREGLLTWRPDPDSKPVVDWSHTTAFGGPCVGHIHVNLAGRDPDGVVPPHMYPEIQQRIIDLLLNYRDPESGLRPVVMAIRKEDAVVFGLRGDRTGDVIYYMREGYTGDFNWFPLTEDGQVLLAMSPDLKSDADYGQHKFVASKFQSAHGCGFPSARLGRGTEEAVFVIAGHGIRGGYQRETPVSLTDVAPTLCYFSGVPYPKQVEGRILLDFSAHDH